MIPSLPAFFFLYCVYSHATCPIHPRIFPRRTSGLNAKPARKIRRSTVRCVRGRACVCAPERRGTPTSIRHRRISDGSEKKREKCAPPRRVFMRRSSRIGPRRGSARNGRRARYDSPESGVIRPFLQTLFAPPPPPSRSLSLSPYVARRLVPALFPLPPPPTPRPLQGSPHTSSR